jgi:hypothetical protein
MSHANPRARTLYQLEVAWEIEDTKAGRHLSFKDAMKKITGFQRMPTDRELRNALAPYEEEPTE